MKRHTYHLVDPSPWPILGGFSALTLTTGAVSYMHRYTVGGFIMLIGIIGLAIVMSIWWRDIIREGTFEGLHTIRVVKGLKLGIILFIVSEVMFFLGFFWAFFHSALSPAVEIGVIWPPLGIDILDPLEIPLLNTVILLSSGASITWAHHSIVGKNKKGAELGLIITIILAITFTLLQAYEYKNSGFTIADGVYGSTFFMATGFHGLHVLIGTTFIIVCYFRLYSNQFTSTHHIGFEGAAWYWHFVDVVWIFLFVSIYYWGS